MVGYYIIDSKADTSMGDNSSVGYWVVKQVITSLTQRLMNGIYTTSGVASHLLGEGHKEPVPATIANNEEDEDDDENKNDLKS